MDKVLWIEGYSRCLGLPKHIWKAFLDGQIELWNAARPLYSTDGREGLLQGEFCRGAFYAVINPNNADAEGLRERNRSLDAQKLEFVSEAQIEKYRADMAAEYGPRPEILDADYKGIVTSYIGHRRRNG